MVNLTDIAQRRLGHRPRGMLLRRSSINRNMRWRVTRATTAPRSPFPVGPRQANDWRNSAARPAAGESWSDFAFGPEPDHQAVGGQVAHRVLTGVCPLRRRTGNLSWSDVSFDRASAERDAVDNDAVVSAVLNNKKQALLLRLGELRSRLGGHGGGQRKGWG